MTLALAFAAPMWIFAHLNSVVGRVITKVIDPGEPGHDW